MMCTTAKMFFRRNKMTEEQLEKYNRMILDEWSKAVKKHPKFCDQFTNKDIRIVRKTLNFMRYEGPRIIDLFGKKVRVLGIRRLTPTECSRLQTIPTWYKWECSDSQAYRMLGNGWTVEVIKHFFQFLPFEKEA